MGGKDGPIHGSGWLASRMVNMNEDVSSRGRLSASLSVDFDNKWAYLRAAGARGLGVCIELSERRRRTHVGLVGKA